MLRDSRFVAAIMSLVSTVAFASAPAFAEDASGCSGKGAKTSEECVRRPKIALALGGGGTRGAAHVSVLKVFEQEGIPIDYIVGTSMGAIVGGMYSAGVPINDLERRFNDGSLMKSFMTVPLAVRVLVAPIMVVPRLWSHPYDGLYKGNKFRNYVLGALPKSTHNIEDSKIPFKACVVSLIDGNVHAIDKGNLGYALQASSAVPGLRKPVEFGDQLFIDGGVRENVPVSIAKKTGADIVVAVCVDEGLPKLPLDHFRKVGSVSKRMVSLELWASDAPFLKQADVVIHPELTGIGLVSTKIADAQRAMSEGEKAARAAIPDIKAKIASFSAVASKSSDNE